MKKILLLIVLSLSFCWNFSQDTAFIDSIIASKYILKKDNPIVSKLDSMLSFYTHLGDSMLTDSYRNYTPTKAPIFEDSTIKNRLRQLDNNTPFSFNFNSVTNQYIRFYEKRRKSISIFLARKETYFPIFEEMLLKYKLPLELKYLPIVESALKPTAESWAGASGLWQFMYNTGKQYGLEADSYVDLRRDPYKSTEAACKHLKKLFKVYGNWELVLAAYNAGGGNVNKAIRKSGGKKNYWEIYSYLPKETRGYVPAFIAVNYIMNYTKEYNLHPVEPLAKYKEIDTLHVHERVDLAVVSRFLNISLEYLRFINPTYYNGIIPKNSSSYSIYLPSQKIGEFITNEESIYSLSKEIAQVYDIQPSNTGNGKKIKYRVRSGDYLGKIAKKYNCRVSDIKRWNNLRSNNLKVGQLLTIYTAKGRKSREKVVKEDKRPRELQSGQSYLLYTIKDGDSLWKIAKQFPGVTVDDLLFHNKNLNENNLKPGNKIKIIQFD